MVSVAALGTTAIVQGALASAAADADGVRAALIWGLAAAAGLIGYYVLCAVIAQIAVAHRHGVEHPAVGAIVGRCPGPRCSPWTSSSRRALRSASSS